MKRPLSRAFGPDTGLIVLAALGVFLAADDQTSVVALLPRMVEDLGVAQDQFFRAAWIVNGYILGYVVALPLVGKAADAYGRGRVFALALVLFCAGSAWVALSNDLTTLVAGRAVQAVGGGAVVPVSIALASRGASSETRPLGLGAMAAASEAGALFGPLWGGGLSELAGWRGVFWVNLPLCLPVALAVWRLDRDHGLWAGAESTNAEAFRMPFWHRLDLTGAVLLGLSLVALTVALTDDPIAPRPAALTLGLYSAAAGLFLLFLLRQARADLPLVDLSLFRGLSIKAAFLCNALAGGVLIVAMVNVPLFTSVILEQSPLQGGLNLMRLTVALPVGALLGGFVVRLLGLRAGATLGLVLAAAGFSLMARWGSDPGELALTAPLLVTGLGIGLLIAPLYTTVIDAVEESQRATVASLLTVVRLLGALVGVALLTTRGLGGFYAAAGLIPLDDARYVELVRGLQVETFQDTFQVTALVCLLAVLPALALKRRHL